MKTHSISRLGRLFGLSRSTLLYYDRIGLLPPSGRTGSGYRYYSEQARRRLDRICQFRQAGLTLDEIGQVLATGGKPGATMLTKRMRQTVKRILELRDQQRILAGMLKRVAAGATTPPVDKEMWVQMLRAAGMNEEGMARWHSEFEHRSPQGHQDFLKSLGISDDEVQRIQGWSRRGGFSD